MRAERADRVGRLRVDSVLVRAEREGVPRDEESPREGRSPEVTYDVVVIGAGQAGLAMGYFLSKDETS